MSYRILQDDDIAYWEEIGGQHRRVYFEDAVEFVGNQLGFEMVEETPDTEDFLNMVVEWFFSGNWVEVDKEKAEEREREGYDEGDWEY